MNSESRRSGIPTQIVLGILIAIVGVVLLVDTTGLYETRPLMDYLPTLFVLLGLYALWRGGLRNFFGPLVVILLAGAWQLAALEIVTWEELWNVWPVVLVIFGLSLVVSHVRQPTSEATVDHIRSVSVFGGSEKRSTSKSFTGADLTAVFGGAELDLRDAAVADRPATVNVVAMFGGVELVVPRDWNVQLEVLPVLGGVTDERPRRDEEHDEIDLVVSGFVAFGGVSIED